MILQIADILPREMQGILACCSPIPPLVRQHLLHLHEIILKAREMPLTSIQHIGQPLAIPKHISIPRELDTDDPLHCVHDLTHLQDIRDDLPTLLSSTIVDYSNNVEPMDLDSVRVSFKSKPQARVFLQNGLNSNRKRDAAIAFTSPYARYTRMKSETLVAESAEKDRIERTRQFFLKTVEGVETSAEQTGASTNDSLPAEDKEYKKTESTTAQDTADSCPREAAKTKKLLPLSSQMKKHKQSKKKISIKRLGVAKNEVASIDTASGTSSYQTRSSSSPAKKVPKKSFKAGSQISENADTVSPFDYSQVDYKGFHRSARDDGSRRGKGNRGRGARGRSNGRANKKSQKSLTYSSK